MSGDQRDVLPVPPELRNHIYDYLLATDEVRRAVTPPDPTSDLRNSAEHHYGSSAHVYRMSTAILRLNHATRNEALSRLYKTNIFVKVTYNCLGLTEMLHRCSVPMICDDTAACQQLSHFSMELKINSTIDWSDECDRDDTCFIMVAEYLPFLCQSLQVLFFDCESRRKSYLPLRDGRVRTFDRSVGGRAILFTFHLHGTKYRKMTAQLEDYLLRPFIDFDFIASSCRITGSVHDEDQIVEKEKYLATRTVWLNIFMWRLLDITQKGFARALSLLHAGYAEAAELFAETMLKVNPWSYFEVIGENIGNVTTELKRCAARYYVAGLDLCVVSWIAYLRQGDYDEDTINIDRDFFIRKYNCLSSLAAWDGELIVLRPFDQNIDPKYAAGMHPDYHWIHALSELLFLDEHTDECWESHIAKLAAVVKFCPEKQYIMHDLEVLETAYDDRKHHNDSSWHDLTKAEKVQKLSITQFDKLNLGTPGHGDFSIPEGISGFIDIEKNKTLQEGRLTVIA